MQLTASTDRPVQLDMRDVSRVIHDRATATKSSDSSVCLSKKQGIAGLVGGLVVARGGRRGLLWTGFIFCHYGTGGTINAGAGKAV